MYSKVVAQQLEVAIDIASAVAKNADDVASSLSRHFAANQADLSPVDWKSVLDTLGQNLLATSGHLAEQDAEYQVQLLLVKQGRDRRDVAIEKVRNLLRGASFLLDQAFGKEKASTYFPERSELTRLRARNLVPLARMISKVLRGTEIVWPPIDNEIHVPKPLELAAGLEAGAVDLEAQLLALAPERKGSVFSRGSKKAEYLATRKALASATRALIGLFQVAGFDYAAERLRPPSRRRSSGDTAGGTVPPPVPQSIVGF
jgi:hypothetical protein